MRSNPLKILGLLIIFSVVLFGIYYFLNNLWGNHNGNSIHFIIQELIIPTTIIVYFVWLARMQFNQNLTITKSLIIGSIFGLTASVVIFLNFIFFGTKPTVLGPIALYEIFFSPYILYIILPAIGTLTGLIFTTVKPTFKKTKNISKICLLIVVIAIIYFYVSM
jgi:hypothetical protein